MSAGRRWRMWMIRSMKSRWRREIVLGSAKRIQHVLRDFDDLGIFADKASNPFTGGGGEYFALSLLPVHDHAVSAGTCIQCFGRQRPKDRARFELCVGLINVECFAPHTCVGLDIGGKPHGEDCDFGGRPILARGIGQAVNHVVI